jgi:hypothetical protein
MVVVVVKQMEAGEQLAEPDAIGCREAAGHSVGIWLHWVHVGCRRGCRMGLDDDQKRTGSR